MSRRTYPDAGGEWETPVRKGYRMACCDCGLVHRVDHRIREGKVQWFVTRDNRATGQLRRWRNIKVTRKYEEDDG